MVVCVDMLGEGFDLPALKIGAIHESRRSLSPMVQLIGRFTRNPRDDRIGTAAVFVARDPSAAFSPLRDLMREDADWNHILNDVTERASERTEDLKAFDESFVDVPDDIPVNLLQPKVSAVAYETASRTWRPENALDLYDVDSVIGGRVSIGGNGSVAWLVIRETQTVRWGRMPGLEEDAYELILMYFDSDHQMLYIHGSNKEGTYKDLAKAVGGEGVDLVRGTATFRVLAGIDRLVPSNVGLLDVRDRRKRFTLVTGSDVNEALDVADSAGRSQTHIVTSGFENGERVTISAALSGRFWSMRSADGLKTWIDWCDVQGGKLRDRSIDLSKLFSRLIIPTELVERPNQVLLALDWPWQIYTVAGGGGRQITFREKAYDLLDVELRVDDYGTQGPFRFSFVTPAWEVPYLIDVGVGGLTFAPAGDDADTSTRGDTQPLHEWLQRHKLNLFLSGDRMIEGDRYYEPRTDIEPYDRNQFTVIPWPGVNIRKESQKTHRDPDSIQAFMSKWLQEHRTFDVLIDDDRAGEAADLVGLQVVESELHVTLVHCKYSKESTPGARVQDLYEVCGQAVRSAKWRQNGVRQLLQHLASRARKYYRRNQVSPFEVGQIEELTRIQEVAVQLTPVFHVIVAQPGLSAAACSSDQLLLIAGADSYVRQTTKGDLTIVCSP